MGSLGARMWIDCAGAGTALATLLVAAAE